MKIYKYLKYFFVGLLIVSFNSACEDDDPEFVAVESTPIVLEDLEIDFLELDASNPNNPALTFNWTNADFGQQLSENYDVEFSTSPDFTDVFIAGRSVGTSSITFTMSTLNAGVGGAGLDPLVVGTIHARIVGSLGSGNALPVVSNAVSFDVIPYFNYIFEDFYLVGNGTMSDWNNNANNPPLFRAADNPNFYSYTGFFTKGGGDFNDGRFKVLEDRGAWQPQWGTLTNEGSDLIVPGGPIAGNPGTQDNDPGRFGVPSSGYYTFTINFATQQYTTEAYDASGAPDFESVTLQGSAIGESMMMTQSSFDSHIWYISNVFLAPGRLTFLTSAGSTWGGITEFSGVATEGSDQIPVIVEDEYEVWFNDLTGEYIMIPLNL